MQVEFLIDDLWPERSGASCRGDLGRGWATLLRNGAPLLQSGGDCGRPKGSPSERERERVFGRRWWSALLGARCALAGDKRQRLILINRHAATAAAFGLAGRPKWAC